MNPAMLSLDYERHFLRFEDHFLVLARIFVAQTGLDS